MAQLIGNILGISGVLTVLIGYFMLQTNRLKKDSEKFCVLNITGSALIMYSLLVDWNLSSFLMESVWLVISLYGLLKAIGK